MQLSCIRERGVHVFILAMGSPTELDNAPTMWAAAPLGCRKAPIIRTFKKNGGYHGPALQPAALLEKTQILRPKKPFICKHCPEKVYVNIY